MKLPKNINFLEEISKLKKPVWEALDAYLQVQIPLGHYHMMRDYPLRQGKYMRPGLLLLAIKMFGGNTRLGILPAAAMQASEEWLLVHDDIEDHSLERRHKPTLNMLYGDELAINTGDALHVIMWKIMADAVKKLHGKNKWKVFHKMNEILLKATEGQYLELEWIRCNKISVTEEEYLDMVKRKTAYYTIIGPLQIGALIAGLTTQDVKQIEEWGLYFGYAFQIWDDCMNLCVPTEKQGKECGGDIMEGKRTLILLHLLSCVNREERKNIEKIYSKKRNKKTEKDKHYVLNLIRLYGSDEYAKKRAQMYGEKALDLFLGSSLFVRDKEARDIIASGIQFATSREQ